MNVERLKMWRDALIEADKKGRVFDITMWRRKVRPRGFSTCPAGDLAMYEPAQALGMRFERGTVCFGHHPTSQFGLGYGQGAICSFLEIERDDAHPSPDEIWVHDTINSTNAAGVYRDAIGGRMSAREVTRAMVLARIEAEIAEREW